MSCLCEFKNIPAAYTVKAGDMDGLSAIVLRLGLCSNKNGWTECLAVAEKIARANNIPWSGPPSWQAPIHVGQVLDLRSVGGREDVVIPEALAPAGNTKRNIILAALGLGGLVLVAVAAKKSSQ